MQRKILNILLTLSITTLIYLGNEKLIEINIFIFILLSTLNKNYYSYLVIIPLSIINPNILLINIIFVLFLGFCSYKINNKKIKNSSILMLSLLFYSYQIFINKMDLNLVYLILLTTLPIILVDSFTTKSISDYVNEMILLCISILTVSYILPLTFFILFSTSTISISFLYNKNYYLITVFFICIYSLYITNNYLYITIQIIAYLCYLFKKLVIKNKTVDGLEFIIDDINQNVVKFCSFITNFSDSNFNSDYEKRVSESIRILIENYCAKCKNRNFCYADKKLHTYIYLKGLLMGKYQANTSSNSKDFFECIYYFDLNEKAKILSKEYNLKERINTTDYKLNGVCYSIQNYFISLFEKASPKIMKILNFKKILIEKNISFTNFEHSILTDEKFQLKITSSNLQKLQIIEAEARAYFYTSNTTIQIKENSVLIYPKKTFKIIYDSATLSHNNCQISGDNFMFKNINDANFICALSDGMGSGYYAYQLSQQTLKMVDQITDCSIEFETSLEILNNFFKTKDSVDSYATLDFIDINLSTGVLNLYKMGSSTTYIYREGKVYPIYNNNLPFGINDLITKEQFNLKNDDLVILVSDGVTDYINENTLINFIENLHKESPHKIVYEILQKIYYENNNQIKDDMSCIVLKLKAI